MFYFSSVLRQESSRKMNFINKTIRFYEGNLIRHIYMTNKFLEEDVSIL